jgi:hypothetical protein
MGFLLCVGDNLVSGRLKGVIQEALRSLCTVHAGRQRVADWKQGAEGHNPNYVACSPKRQRGRHEVL